MHCILPVGRAGTPAQLASLLSRRRWDIGGGVDDALDVPLGIAIQRKFPVVPESGIAGQLGQPSRHQGEGLHIANGIEDPPMARLRPSTGPRR